VRRVDAGGFEPHAHLAVAGLRCRQLAADQNLVSRSLPVVLNRAHLRPPRLSPRRRSIMFRALSPRRPMTGKTFLHRADAGRALPIGGPRRRRPTRRVAMKEGNLRMTVDGWIADHRRYAHQRRGSADTRPSRLRPEW